MAAHKLDELCIGKYDGSGTLRQSFGSTGLVLRGDVGKDGCITKLSIKSLRDSRETDGYAALVAWLSLVAVTNPALTPEERKATLNALGLDRPRAGGTHHVGRVTYSGSSRIQVGRVPHYES
jgi:hypothetical protein